MRLNMLLLKIKFFFLHLALGDPAPNVGSQCHLFCYMVFMPSPIENYTSQDTPLQWKKHIRRAD